jgi:Flp pilus assembly protein TadD
LFACLLICAPLCRADVLADADGLIRAGRPGDALTLLLPLEHERAGQPAYDALLGAALLRTGDAPRASLALERATSVDPGLADARPDLAIAYYQMGDRAQARQMFTSLRARSASGCSTSHRRLPATHRARGRASALEV